MTSDNQSNTKFETARPTHTQPHGEEERWNPADEPTRVERLIAAQFRRGIVVPLKPKEQQDLLHMSLEQRCDYIAKICVYTARHIEKHLLATEVK